jgi:hypothetical protein
VAGSPLPKAARDAILGLGYDRPQAPAAGVDGLVG